MTAHYIGNVLVKKWKTCISLLATYGVAFNALLKNTEEEGPLAFTKLLKGIVKIIQHVDFEF